MKNSTNYSTITAIILASGKGIRFGKPKAEAEVDGVNFANAITSTLQQAGLDNIHVARGYPTGAMLETLKVAIKELTDTGKTAICTGFLCFPVDFPFVTARTIKEIAEAHLDKPQAIIRPSYQGYSGHPIIIPANLNLGGDDDGKGLRGIILHSGLPILNIEVEDIGIHRNINTLEDLFAWTAKN